MTACAHDRRPRAAAAAAAPRTKTALVVRAHRRALPAAPGGGADIRHGAVGETPRAIVARAPTAVVDEEPRPAVVDALASAVCIDCRRVMRRGGLERMRAMTKRRRAAGDAASRRKIVVLPAHQGAAGEAPRPVAARMAGADEPLRHDSVHARVTGVDAAFARALTTVMRERRVVVVDAHLGCQR